MNRFEYVIASSLDEAVEALGTGRSAILKASGLDVLDLWKSGIEQPERIVSIHAVSGLIGIRREGNTVRIGAGATLAEIAASGVVREALPALAQAAEEAATPAVRTRATLGGNLCQRPRCWYFRHPDFRCLKKGGAECYAREGENEFHAIFGNETCAAVHPSNTAVPLVAYGAVAHTTRREIPLERFFVSEPQRENVLEHGEIIREVQVPVPQAPSAYVEIRHKASFDWPLASAAVVLGDDPRVVLGGVATVPMRHREAERALARGDAPEAARLATAGARPLAKNRYKVSLVEVVVRRAIARAREAGR
jgi:xanthine dehydrogenase YagS FAD-binding subunit